MLDFSTVSAFSDSPGTSRTFSGAAAGNSASARQQTSCDSSAISATHQANNAFSRQVRLFVKHNDAALPSGYASNTVMMHCER